MPLVVNTSNKSKLDDLVWYCFFSKLKLYPSCVTGDAFLRHPNSYLPRYNIQSETDGETSLASSKLLNNSDLVNKNQIVESDEEDVPAYGFPKRRNRREASDIDRIINHCGLSAFTFLNSLDLSRIKNFLTLF